MNEYAEYETSISSVWYVLREKVGFESVFHDSKRRQYHVVVNNQAVESVILDLPLWCSVLFRTQDKME